MSKEWTLADRVCAKPGCLRKFRTLKKENEPELHYCCQIHRPDFVPRGLGSVWNSEYVRGNAEQGKNISELPIRRAT